MNTYLSIAKALLLFVCLFILYEDVNASYCGQAAIPYSLEILPNGQPVLGCARPSCFGWTANGSRSADSAQFYKIGKHSDGFFRTPNKKNPTLNAIGFQPQYSICDRSYLSTQCSGASWVGGIAPLSKIEASDPMRLMCCYYNKLSDAGDNGSAEVRTGQIITGGEMTEKTGRQTAFEYIGNIQRLFDRNGVLYIVTMKKFSCVPEPTVTQTNVEQETTRLLIDNINEAPTPTSSQQKQFAYQKFELPNTLPQEDVKNIIVNVDTAQSNKNNESNDVKSALSLNKFETPQAKPMDDKEETLNHSGAKAFGASNKEVVVPSKLNTRSSTLAPNTNNYYNYNPYPQQYLQLQQQFQQQQYPQQSLFDPLGWFSHLQPLNTYNNNYYQQQQQQQQQLQYGQQYNNGYNNYNINNNVVQPGNNAQDQRTALVNNPQPVQTLPPTLFTLAPTFQASRQQLPQLSNGQQLSSQNTNEVSSILPSSPLINIPEPEDIEKAIPPSSRQLINNVVRTFFGYFE